MNSTSNSHDEFTLWPWFGSRPNRPFWASKAVWDAPRGRWWTGIPREHERELER